MKDISPKESLPKEDSSEVAIRHIKLSPECESVVCQNSFRDRKIVAGNEVCIIMMCKKEILAMISVFDYFSINNENKRNIKPYRTPALGSSD